MNTWCHVLTAFPGIWSERSYDRVDSHDLIKSKPSEFFEWVKVQPQSIKQLIHPCKKDNRWAIVERVGRIFVEVDPHGRPLDEPYIQEIRQRFVLCKAPRSSHAGNLYNDDPKWGIYIKFGLSALARPVHLLAKTAYHLFQLGAIRGLIRGVQTREKTSLIMQRVLRSEMNIIRTPIYEIAMEIVALVALVSSPFKATLLYDFRAFTGQLSHELFWGKRLSLPADLTPCMRRIGNVIDFGRNKQRILEDSPIDYEDPANPLLVALDNKLILHKNCRTN